MHDSSRESHMNYEQAEIGARIEFHAVIISSLRVSPYSSLSRKGGGNHSQRFREMGLLLIQQYQINIAAEVRGVTYGIHNAPSRPIAYPQEHLVRGNHRVLDSEFS